MQHALMRSMVQALDDLEIGVCAFDPQDCAVIWNGTFLRFFPEHAGDVHVGEHYAENLRRFYAGRLNADEEKNVDVFIRDGGSSLLSVSAGFV